MPRTAGGAINPQRAAEAYYAAKERDNGCKVHNCNLVLLEHIQHCIRRRTWREQMETCIVVESKRFLTAVEKD